MPNRLAQERSPYLLQHAENPVEWFPWGEEAFALAQAHDKPIFLSIGYATCHWCHVMERESFEDPEIARLLNEHFIAIKVDREERPDIDQIYMEALLALRGSGGWPLNLFLTPQGLPFFGGTYFPPDNRLGQPSFKQVLLAVIQAWQRHRSDLETEAQALQSALQRSFPTSALPDDLHHRALERILEAADPIYGGLQGSPKFPQAPLLRYLLIWSWLGSSQAQEHLLRTLNAMRSGGIYDQLGGGFHRYSTDEAWRIPHFEKMLYDNAQLAELYLQAGILFEEPLFVRTARETLDYMLRELSLPEGALASAQDADSEGIEGKLYTWSWQEWEEAFGAQASQVAPLFGVFPEGNWEGTNVIQKEGTPELRAHLFALRERRPKPSLDDQVLADWNGLALRAFAMAGRILEEPRYLDAAQRIARFLLDHLFSGGLMLHSWRGTPGKLSTLSDQASVGLGLLELYQTTQESSWLEEARRLAQACEVFLSPQGGFFDAVAPGLPRPAQEIADGPVASGNTLAIELLARLGSLLEETRWHALAEQALQAHSFWLLHQPLGVPGLLSSHLVTYWGSEILVAEPSPLSSWIRHQVWPLSTLVFGPPGQGLLRGKEEGWVYPCRFGACSLPSQHPETLHKSLQELYRTLQKSPRP